MKERTRKYVKLSLILYVALLSAAVIATTAWFITSRTASIKSSDDDMVIQAGQQLEISMANGSTDWGSTIKVPVLNQSIPDITGDGVNFYYPATLDSNDEPIMNDASTFLDVSENPNGEYYIELKVKFRTAAQTKVYLANTSSITPKDLTSVNDLTETVSKDILAGAVRVCFFEESDPTNRIIWIPNDRYQLNSAAVGHSFVQNGEREDSYGYLLANTASNQITAYNWDVSHFRTGKVMVGNTALASPSTTVDDVVVPAMTNGGAALLSFEGGTEKTEKTLVIRVWVEGTDREAVTDLVGGQFSYDLNFISINKEENNNSLSTVTWSGNTLNGITGGTNVEYSFNAIDWMSYSNQIAGDTGYDTVYVREKETATKTCGVVNAIPRSSVTE